MCLGLSMLPVPVLSTMQYCPDRLTASESLLGAYFTVAAWSARTIRQALSVWRQTRGMGTASCFLFSRITSLYASDPYPSALLECLFPIRLAQNSV